jgi:hypothetical protein
LQANDEVKDLLRHAEADEAERGVEASFGEDQTRITIVEESVSAKDDGTKQARSQNYASEWLGDRSPINSSPHHTRLQHGDNKRIHASDDSHRIKAPKVYQSVGIYSLCLISFALPNPRTDLSFQGPRAKQLWIAR